MNIFGVMALPSYLNVLAIFAQTGLDFIANPLITISATAAITQQIVSKYLPDF